jgi:hypothetical protein
MPLTEDNVIRQFSKWTQDKCQLRLSLSIPAVSLSLLGTSEVVSASLENGRFELGVGEFEFSFLSADASFEYTNPSARAERCLTVSFRDPLPRKPAGPPDATLMLCELP